MTDIMDRIKLAAPELGIEQELLNRSLEEAYHVCMNRFTLLSARNELTQIN
jgi:hypothetical protein